MANFISIFRIFVMFAAVYLIYPARVTQLHISGTGFNYYCFCSRRFRRRRCKKISDEETKIRCNSLDIMGDRIVENTYWILFAAMWMAQYFIPVDCNYKRFYYRVNKKCSNGTRFNSFAMQVNPGMQIYYRF